MLTAAIAALLVTLAGSATSQDSVAQHLLPATSRSARGQIRPISRRGGITRHTAATAGDLTGEFVIDTCVYYGPEEYGQQYPAVACGCSTGLVVWFDERGGNEYICASRVSASGEVLDPAGIEVFTSSEYFGHQRPAVVTDGSTCLVVWRYSDGNYADIYGALVSLTGVVMTPGGFPICTAAWEQTNPAVAFDGTNYLVVWQDDRNGNGDDVYAARVNPGGGVLDPYGISVNAEDGNQNNPAVSYGLGNFLVTWHDDRCGNQIYAARVSSSGSVLDPYGFALTNATGSRDAPAAAFDGTNFLVVWQDSRAGLQTIYGARVSSSGNLLDSNGIAFPCDTGTQANPAVVSGPADCLVLWADHRKGNYDIYAARISPSGIVLDSSGFIVSAASGDQTTPAIAGGGTEYLAVWDDGRNPVGYLGAIYGTRLGFDGEVLDPNGIFISSVPNRQYVPRVVFDGTNTLVVFEDRRDGASDVYGMRISPDGVRLDSTSIGIATGPNFQMCPAAAAGDTYYLVAYEERPANAIQARRVAFSGRVVDSTPIALSGGNYADVAFDGTNYFVTWQGSSTILGARVSQSGHVLVPGIIRLCNLSNSNSSAAVACGDSSYLVTWVNEWYSHPYYHDIIRGVRVRFSGEVIDSVPMTLSDDNMFIGYPRIVFNGTDFLVVWDEFYDIYGRLVSQDGTVHGLITICTATNNQESPVAVRDRTSSLVVWTDNRTGTYYNLRGASLNAAGTILDTFVVSTQPCDQSSPSVATIRPNRMLVAFSEITDSINGHPVGLPRIWGKVLPVGGLLESSQPYGVSCPIVAVPSLFRSTTRLDYAVGRSGPVVLKVHDAAGGLVRVLVNGSQPKGHYSVLWDGSDGSGCRLPEGVYFVRMQTECRAAVTRRVTMLH